MDENQVEVVENSMSLLRQMRRRPGRVRAAFEEAAGEGEDAASRLRALEEQASRVQTERELLEVADEVYRLVEDTPTLAEGLLPKGRDVEAARRKRWFSIKDSERSPEELYVQKHRDPMLNDVREIRWVVEQPPPEDTQEMHQSDPR